MSHQLLCKQLANAVGGTREGDICLLLAPPILLPSQEKNGNRLVHGNHWIAMFLHQIF